MIDKAPLFELQDIEKRFPNGNLALKGISLNIYEGESLLIAGSNGSGKTVLMHILAGLTKPSAGQLSYRGKKMSRAMGLVRQEVGLVFQEADAQILGETVEADIAWGPKERALFNKKRLSAIPATVARCIQSLGLQGKEKQATQSLSGGEKRRLAVAGVLALGASCIIFDEPFANLDWPGVQQVLRIITELQKAGLTLIILTHELEKVLAHVHRLAILDGGKLCDYGPPQEVLDRGLAAWGIRDPRQNYTHIQDCSWLV